MRRLAAYMVLYCDLSACCGCTSLIVALNTLVAADAELGLDIHTVGFTLLAERVLLIDADVTRQQARAANSNQKMNYPHLPVPLRLEPACKDIAKKKSIATATQNTKKMVASL
jgi:hypothetical protein